MLSLGLVSPGLPAGEVPLNRNPEQPAWEIDFTDQLARAALSAPTAGADAAWPVVVDWEESRLVTKVLADGKKIPAPGGLAAKPPAAGWKKLNQRADSLERREVEISRDEWKTHAVWLRKRVTVPKEGSGARAQLYLNRVVSHAKLFVNGQPVSEVAQWQMPAWIPLQKTVRPGATVELAFRPALAGGNPRRAQKSPRACDRRPRLGRRGRDRHPHPRRRQTPAPRPHLRLRMRRLRQRAPHGRRRLARPRRHPLPRLRKNLRPALPKLPPLRPERRQSHFFRGKAGEGLGSPHLSMCGEMIWPLGIAVRGLTATDPKETQHCLRLLLKTHAGTGFMHEGFHKDDATKFTRTWFAWANTWFGQFVHRVYQKHPRLLA